MTKKRNFFDSELRFYFFFCPGEQILGMAIKDKKLSKICAHLGEGEQVLMSFEKSRKFDERREIKRLHCHI
ncbi:hypothetical protein RJ44_19485 [Alteromonas macleodii]|nr:hypothetical protein RJ44_19485 [Alteromonas macleodii]